MDFLTTELISEGSDDEHCLLNDINLHMWSRGTLVPKGPWCLSFMPGTRLGSFHETNTDRNGVTKQNTHLTLRKITLERVSYHESMWYPLF